MVKRTLDSEPENLLCVSTITQDEAKHLGLKMAARTWMVSEHRKRGFPEGWLADTFGAPHEPDVVFEGIGSG